MITNTSKLLIRLSTTPVTLACLVIFILFTALVLPGQTQSADEYSGESSSPDLSFFYSRDYVYELAGEYGETGRQAYVQARYTFDIAWPLVYTLFLATSISWTLSRSLPGGSRWLLVNITPLAAMLLDLLENLSTSLVMLAYPDQVPLAAWLAPLFTLFKWIFVGASFITLVAGVVLYLVKKFKPGG